LERDDTERLLHGNSSSKSNPGLSAGFRRGRRDATSDAALRRGDAHPVKTNSVGFLKARDLYRERIDVEIGKASERGARWWSRRLVQLYEDAGLVRLDK
jgi:hypothetical protein